MDILEQLADHARERVEEKKRIIPPGEMKRLADIVKPAARISFDQGSVSFDQAVSSCSFLNFADFPSSIRKDSSSGMSSIPD